MAADGKGRARPVIAFGGAKFLVAERHIRIDDEGSIGTLYVGPAFRSIY